MVDMSASLKNVLMPLVQFKIQPNEQLEEAVQLARAFA